MRGICIGYGSDVVTWGLRACCNTGSAVGGDGGFRRGTGFATTLRRMARKVSGDSLFGGDYVALDRVTVSWMIRPKENHPSTCIV